MLAPWKKSYDKYRVLEIRDHFADKGPYSQSYGISISHVWMWGLDCKEGLALKNVAFELCCWRRLLRASWTVRRSKHSVLKEITLNIHWKDWCWSWSSNTLDTWCKEPDHWKIFWCWERFSARGKGGNRGWDYWMESLNQWTWVSPNSETY